MICYSCYEYMIQFSVEFNYLVIASYLPVHKKNSLLSKIATFIIQETMECLLQWEMYASIKLIMRSRTCVYGPELTTLQFLCLTFYQYSTIIL